MRKVYQVGPDIALKGGISTVIREINDSEDMNSMYSIKLIKTISNNRLKTFFKSIIDIRKIEKDSIVHFHVASKGSFFRKYILYKLSKKDTKKIFHLHGGGFFNFYNNSNGLIKYCIKDMIEGCDLIINVSDYMLNELKNIFPCFNEKMIRIYNGVNLNNNNLPFEEKSNSILFLGKLIEYKGIYEFIDIIESNKEFLREKKWNVIIAGNGEIEKVNKILHEKELASLVNLVGWIDGTEKESILNKAKIMVMPSHVESFGISAIEGMSKGISVVCSDVGALPEVVINGKNGFVTKLDNEYFGQKIRLLIEDEGLMKKIYINNIDYCNKFSVDSMINNFIKQYKSIDGDNYEK